MNTRKGFAPIILLIIIVLLVAGVGAYYLYSKDTNKESVQVDDWKTYTNEEYGFEFKYPSEYSLQVSSSLEKRISIQLSKDNKIVVNVSADKDYAPGDLKYFLDTSSSNTLETNGNLWNEYILEQGYQDAGSQSSEPIYAVRIEKNKALYTVTAFAKEDFDDLKNQILPTFIFSEEGSSPPPAVQLLPTTGWLEVENQTFSLKYPAGIFEPESGDTYIEFQRKADTSVGPIIFSIVENYNGGSRRVWYLDYFSYSSSDVGDNIFFSEKTLGTVAALEVSTPTADNIKNILVSNGTNLINVSIQDPDITLVETIVSTLKFK